VTELRKLRAVLVGASPLLVDLIRRVAATRLAQAGVELSIVAEVGDLAAAGDPSTQVGAPIPDLIIVGQVTAPPRQGDVVAPMLALSLDLTRIYGPGPDDVVALTPETLAAKLLSLTAPGKPRLS
jgi:hypothetical protein